MDYKLSLLMNQKMLRFSKWMKNKIKYQKNKIKKNKKYNILNNVH